MRKFRIGLVGDLDHLRPHLEGASFQPYGGPFGHPETTSDIDALLEQGARTPILVSVRAHDPTWLAWLRKLLESHTTVVLVGSLPDGVELQRVRSVPATATLADALLACGASRAMVPESLRSVPVAGKVSDRFVRAPASSGGAPASPIAPDRLSTANSTATRSDDGDGHGRMAAAGSSTPACPVATGVNTDGHREILGLDVCSVESHAGWLTFFRGLTARGLSGVSLVTSDAHPGLVAAVAATLPGASWGSIVATMPHPIMRRT